MLKKSLGISVSEKEKLDTQIYALQKFNYDFCKVGSRPPKMPEIESIAGIFGYEAYLTARGIKYGYKMAKAIIPGVGKVINPLTYAKGAHSAAMSVVYAKDKYMLGHYQNELLLATKRGDLLAQSLANKKISRARHNIKKHEDKKAMLNKKKDAATEYKKSKARHGSEFDKVDKAVKKEARKKAKHYRVKNEKKRVRQLQKKIRKDRASVTEKLELKRLLAKSKIRAAYRREVMKMLQ